MPGVEILPGFYIKTALTSDREIPSHWARLCIREGSTPEHPPDLLHLKMADDVSWSPETISQILEFIDSRLKRGVPVLVECVAGVSRSPSAILAYMVHRDGLTVDEALERLRSIYPPADPSARILDSLKGYFCQGE